ncbi:MAG: recombination protein RecR [Abitibacteriaceae bacterium]|nr:recombination protein RecR [Abditibacteriaceae bacterium]MBV9864026.1 recombination protein RecR [Abditibacteriaceae bacterium]
MLYYARPLAELLEQLEKLPGIGPKSAQRLAFHILRAPREDSENLARAVRNVREQIKPCTRCGSFTDLEICDICTDPRRDNAALCVVAEARELMAVENSGEFRGRYHVLGGLMNPIEGIGPDQLNINALVRRVGEENISEVILALSPTVEGETTTNYLANLLKPRNVRVTQLARGLPFGGDLDYADQMTIAGAMRGRREF